MSLFSRSTIVTAALAAWSVAGAACGADWIFAPSTYTHDEETGQRVAQYAPVPPVYAQSQPGYMKSGYRHNRSTIRVGDSADRHHVVEEWGRPVRPYGEWRHPYRPYSVPYHLWGPPYAGLGFPYGNGLYPGYGPHPGHRRFPDPRRPGRPPFDRDPRLPQDFDAGGW